MCALRCISHLLCSLKPYLASGSAPARSRANVAFGEAAQHAACRAVRPPRAVASPPAVWVVPEPEEGFNAAAPGFVLAPPPPPPGAAEALSPDLEFSMGPDLEVSLSPSFELSVSSTEFDSETPALGFAPVRSSLSGVQDTSAPMSRSSSTTADASAP